MTSETPCLSGCREWPTYPSNGIGWANSDGVSVTHAPNCPNAPKPAEPQSEPPIDPEPWVKITDWHIKERPQHAMTGLCRAFKSLKAERDILKLALAEESGYLKRASAERDALKHDIACLETKVGIERRAGAATAENAALKARVEELESVIVEYREAGKLIGSGRLDRGMNRQIDYARVNAASRRLNETADAIRARKEQENTNAR